MPCFGDDGDVDEEVGRLPGEQKYAKASSATWTQTLLENAAFGAPEVSRLRADANRHTLWQRQNHETGPRQPRVFSACLQEYEARLNPFEEFKQAEAHRGRARLPAHDRALLTGPCLWRRAHHNPCQRFCEGSCRPLEPRLCRLVVLWP